MSFISKPLELLEESDLQALLDNEVPEGKTIDYKEALSGRIRNFRHQRRDMILSRETPINMNPGAKIVLHIIPIGAFDPAFNFDVTSLKQQNPSPLSGTQWDFRYNFDGFLCFTNTLYSYTQTFRNGIIEAVDAFILEPREPNNFSRNIPSIQYEEKVIQKLSEYISVQNNLGVEPPFLIMLSLLDVKGYSMSVSQAVCWIWIVFIKLSEIIF